MSKSFIYGLIVGIVLLIVGVSAGSRIQQKNSKETEAQRELRLFEKEVVDATPTQLGVLTVRQQSHSKLYSVYKERIRRKISDFIAHPEGKVLGVGLGVGLGPRLKESQTPEEYFGKLANASDAIIRGRVVAKASQITEDDTFIFTDYDVEVTEVFGNNKTSPLATGRNIVVTRPGGKIVVDGIIVEVTDDHFLPLPVDGNEVVLFLHYIPETGAYQATRDTGSFQLDGEILRPLTALRFPPGVLGDSNSFLQTVRAIQNK
jgi:hypothetical protein